MELIIFDLDGTLIDSRIDIANSVNYTLKQLGLSPLDEKIILGYIGDGVRSLIERALLPSNLNLFEKGLSTFLAYYSEHLLDNTFFFPGVTETLKFFADKKMAVISNKLEVLSINTLKGLGIFSFFKSVVGGDSLEKKKPAPEPVLKVLNDLNVAKEKAIIVGDSYVDIEAGKGAQIMTCGVTYGFKSRDAILKAEPDFMIDHLIELKEIIY
ncbi:MAG: HAD-IA family hydrolase [Nitrospirae bacterium]|nr:HAD-IA family hydrolase [Nitrospirota bacterium]